VETRSYNATTTDLSSIVSVKGATTVASSTYTYDNLGRKLTDAGIGYTSTYAYDAAGQLITENRTGSSPFTSSYTYDNAGNRLTKVLNGATESYTYDNANKMLTAGTKSYSYDSAGNVTGVTWAGGSRTLAWDAESRLKSTTSAGSTVNYAYNGMGQRVAKSGAAAAAYLLGDDSIDAEVLSDGSATYAHGVAGLVSENRGGTTKVYHSDALDSVRALTNISGTVTDSRSTDAFGNVTTTTGTTPTPFGFAGGFGYQQDSETGLMRLGHRMYDSSTGRFISRDPIQDDYNWYVYCDNDPIDKTIDKIIDKVIEEAVIKPIVKPIVREIERGIKKFERALRPRRPKKPKPKPNPTPPSPPTSPDDSGHPTPTQPGEEISPPENSGNESSGGQKAISEITPEEQMMD
jgi:RHS repeat-associated protein